MTDVSALQNAQKVLKDAGVPELVAQIENLQKEIMEKSKSAFKDVAKALFDAFPSLESFSWVQYTPYFNDGEPCEFGVSADADWSLKINGERPGDSEHWETKPIYIDKEGNQYTEAEYKNQPASWRDRTIRSRFTYLNAEEPELNGVPDTIEDFINAIDENTLQSMFGDHCEVIVYRDRVEVQDYDHD